MSLSEQQKISKLEQELRKLKSRNIPMQQKKQNHDDLFGSGGTMQYLDENPRNIIHQKHPTNLKLMIDDRTINQLQPYDDQQQNNNNQLLDVDESNVMQLEELQQEQESVNNNSTNTSGSLTKKEEFKIESVSFVTCTYPVDVQNNKKSQKKYEVDMTYRIKSDIAHKIHKRKIKFGLKGKEDYVDHHDIIKKKTLLKRLLHQKNFLKSNFWRKEILNGKSTIIANNFINTIYLLQGLQ